MNHWPELIQNTAGFREIPQDFTAGFPLEYHWIPVK